MDIGSRRHLRKTVHLEEEAKLLVEGEGLFGDGEVTEGVLVWEDMFDAPGDPAWVMVCLDVTVQVIPDLRRRARGRARAREVRKLES